MQLHYYPSNASMVPHLLLEEIGVPYELVLVVRGSNAHKSPAYLALNPNGKVPLLVDGDTPIFESLAILIHLGETYGVEKGTLIPSGSMSTMGRAWSRPWSRTRAGWTSSDPSATWAAPPGEARHTSTPIGRTSTQWPTTPSSTRSC